MIATELLHHFFNLDRQLTGWEQDQPLSLNLGQALEHRDPEGKRFSRSGLGDTDHILAFNRDRDGLRLDWGGNGILQPRQRFE